MNDLLNLAMKAHGGLERWKQVRNMQAKVTLNGTLWRIKGRPDGLSGVVMRLNTKEPDLTITPFPELRSRPQRASGNRLSWAARNDC